MSERSTRGHPPRKQERRQEREPKGPQGTAPASPVVDSTQSRRPAAIPSHQINGSIKRPPPKQQNDKTERRITEKENGELAPQNRPGRPGNGKLLEGTSRSRDRGSCVGFSERVELQRRSRAMSNKPRPWVERKLTVCIVIGIVGFCFYTYVARFCIPMLKQRGRVLGSRSLGIAFLVIYSVLSLMFFWSYIKVVLTPPGYARDFVPKCARPEASRPPRHPESSSDTDGFGTPYEAMSQSGHGHQTEPSASHHSLTTPPSNQRATQASQPPTSPPVLSTSQSDSAPIKRHRSGSGTQTPTRSVRDNTSGSKSRRSVDEVGRRTIAPAGVQRSASAGPSNAPPTPTTPATLQPAVLANPKLRPIHPATEPTTPQPLSQRSRRDGMSGSNSYTRAATRDPQHSAYPFTRRPPSGAPLLPENRYCSRDEIIKPMRAHHCRVCATCILLYDHHCPWIGQCVGAFNRKFFVNFSLWSTIWTLWIFLTLIILNVREGTKSIDAVQIVLIALSGFFTVFTATIFIQHVTLICMNQTIVESLKVHDMLDRESAMLGHMVPFWDFRKRKAIRAAWDKEWGSLRTEGNLWWLGRASANWESVMGSSVWGWFLPIGRGLGDGINFQRNPRFDADGRWRRRSEWPADLQ